MDKAIWVSNETEADALAVLLLSSVDFDFSAYNDAANRMKDIRSQKQTELKQTIEALPMVDKAIVFIDVSENPCIYEPRIPSGVSVVILNPEFNGEQIEIIKDIVYKTIGINPENVTIDFR